MLNEKCSLARRRPLRGRLSTIVQTPVVVAKPVEGYLGKEKEKVEVEGGNVQIRIDLEDGALTGSLATPMMQPVGPSRGKRGSIRWLE